MLGQDKEKFDGYALGKGPEAEYGMSFFRKFMEKLGLDPNQYDGEFKNYARYPHDNTRYDASPANIVQFVWNIYKRGDINYAEGDEKFAKMIVKIALRLIFLPAAIPMAAINFGYKLINWLVNKEEFDRKEGGRWNQWSSIAHSELDAITEGQPGRIITGGKESDRAIENGQGWQLE